MIIGTEQRYLEDYKKAIEIEITQTKIRRYILNEYIDCTECIHRCEEGCIEPCEFIGTETRYPNCNIFKESLRNYLVIEELNLT